MNHNAICETASRAEAKSSFRALRALAGLNLPLAALGIVLMLSGCATPPTNDAKELAAFDKAGPIGPSTCILNFDTSMQKDTSYHLAAGDLLELQLPALATNQFDVPQDKVLPFTCRVHDDGTIGLPIVGKINATGKTLPELEHAIADAYSPKYLRSRPTIAAKVTEYKTFKVAITGGVKEPGLYELRSDEMTIPVLVAKAKGLSPEGAIEVRIRRQGAASPVVISLITPAAADEEQMGVKSGDLVEVVKPPPQTFTILGLVKSPGVHPYPVSANYTLASAVAAGGGVDALADPKYAIVFRQDAEGNARHRRCLIDPQAKGHDAGIPIKPGDVVVVENSIDIQAKLVLYQMLRIGTGLSYGF